MDHLYSFRVHALSHANGTGTSTIPFYSRGCHPRGWNVYLTSFLVLSGEAWAVVGGFGGGPGSEVGSGGPPQFYGVVSCGVVRGHGWRAILCGDG
jgi:hypothetical protein